VWEANHVWLIFVLVLMWTAFPPAFAAISSTLYLPLTLVALGVIARGAGFAFSKAIDQPWARRLFGAAFAFSSLVTPWFLWRRRRGRRLRPGAAGAGPRHRGHQLAQTRSASSPASLAVAGCAFLAASYLALDARRAGDDALTWYFRRRALASGLVVMALSVASLLVLRADAPALYTRLTGRALPLIAVAIAAGVASLALAWLGKLVALRLSAAIAVGAVLWAWATAQYPYLLLPGLTVAGGSAPGTTLTAVIISTAVGGALVIPSLAWLLILAQRGPQRREPEQREAQPHG